MRIRTIKNCPVPEHEYAYIYFLCMNYDRQVEFIREFIDYIITLVCESDVNSERALSEILKQGYNGNAEVISMNHYMTKNKLYSLRKRFFSEFHGRERDMYV